MSRLLLTLLVGLALASVPVAAQAADGKDHGLLLRVNGDVTVARGESVNTVVVVDGDLVVDGDVQEGLVIVHGNAVITGTVQGAVTVIDGDLSLRRGSSVEDVNLVRSTLHRDEGSTVTGKINHRQNFVFRGAWAIFTVLFWVGMTIAILVSGLLFAAIGGRQLTTAARALTGEVGKTILGAVVFWIAVPVLAVILFVTVVGIPLGLGLLLFVLPGGWFMGYIVAGTRLGGAVTGLAGKEHPYAAAALGLVALQLIALIPGIGWLVLSLAGIWGAGSLALIALRAVRGRPAEPPGPAVAAGEPAGAAG
jgi:hypothetical protein